MNCFNGLYFHNKLPADKKVEARIPDDLAFELEHDRLLPLVRNVSQIKFNGERLFIYGFQKTRPK